MIFFWLAFKKLDIFPGEKKKTIRDACKNCVISVIDQTKYKWVGNDSISSDCLLLTHLFALVHNERENAIDVSMF